MENIYYSNKLEKFAIQSFESDKPKIIETFNNRDITNILHFTHITNLISILNIGLRSIHNMTKNNIQFLSTDSKRLDEIYHGICCSLAYPNIWMLNNKIGLNSSQYAVIELSENTLLLNPFAAFPGNSARSDLKKDADQNTYNYVGYKGLTRLFLNKSIRKKEAIKKFVPTDLQSEIIFFNEISSDRIRKIHFPGGELPDYRNLYQDIQKNFPEIILEFRCLHGFFNKYNPRGFDGRKFSFEWEKD